MVWICSRCEKGLHDNCENTVSCDCQCNINSVADTTQKVLAITGGIGLALGGLALTILSGGLLIPVGGAMLGAGISSTYQGVEKTIKKERISGGYYCADVAFGAVTGVLTGGIGAAGEAVATNVVKQGAKEVVKVGAKKLVIRTAAGAVAGVTSKAVDEIKVCTTTDKSWSDFGKIFDQNGKEKGTGSSWAVSAVVGGLGGVGGHISSNATKAVSSGVAKSAIRIGVSGTTAAVGDTTAQVANIVVGNQDTFDPERTATSFAASSITAAAYEGAQNSMYKLGGGKDQILLDKANEKMIRKKVPKNERKKALNGYKNLKKIPKSTLIGEGGKAQAITQKSVHKTKIDNYNKKIQETLDSRQDAIKSNDRPLIKQQQQNPDELSTQKKVESKSFNEIKSTITRKDIQYMNKQNAHVLVDAKVNQVAFDVNPPNENLRGSKRVVFDYDINHNEGRSAYKFAGYTEKHDYRSIPDYGKSDYQQIHSNCENDLRMIRGQANNLICNQIIGSEEKEE